MKKSRKVHMTLKRKPTIEGAGVHLNRVFGFSESPTLDPFLMLDDFRSNNPEHYLKGFPWHEYTGRVGNSVSRISGRYFYQAKMKSPYFLTTERLGFRCWTKDDFGLALDLWGDHEGTRYAESFDEISPVMIKKEMP